MTYIFAAAFAVFLTLTFVREINESKKDRRNEKCKVSEKKSEIDLYPESGITDNK